MGACKSVLLGGQHDWSPVKFSDLSAANKDLEMKWMLDSLLKTPAFLDFSDRRVEEILTAMCDEKKDNERTFQAGEFLCKIGDKSDCFWYVRNGEIAVFTGEGKQVAVKKKGNLTGEVGMIQNVDRTATLKAVRLSTIIRIKREDYEKVRAKSEELEKSASHYAMIATNLFHGWDKRTMMNVLDIMRGIVPEKRVRDVSNSSKITVIPAREMTNEERRFPPGHVIMTQGETPHPIIAKKGEKTIPATDYMYIVEEGVCDVIIEGIGKVAEKKFGDFFGEMALLNDTARSATIKAGPEGAILLLINREQFNRYFLRDRSKFEYTIMQIQRKANQARGVASSVTVDSRRGATSKRQSVALDDLDDVLSEKRNNKMTQSASVKVTKLDKEPSSALPKPPLVTPPPAAPDSGRDRTITNMTQGELEEWESGDTFADVITNPTKWLDWVPGVSIKANKRRSTY